MSVKVSKEQLIRNVLKNPELQATGKTQTSFQQNIKRQQGKLQEEILGQLLNKIEGQANRLAVSQTIKDVQLYKSYIQQLIKEVLQSGLEMKQSKSWHPSSAHRQALVKKIDQKLIQLTDEVLNKHTDSISLLAKLGEIKGLLINLCI
ncbi:uncharacterized protein YaaR (DUF327 family) [Scopulibacillus daqui]|uniref:Uncharacterized protein YaaR (DUF327 family) n=1 Tax=Scopulibacillus daqui TaxID=1469162 RepID=A0ABS2Q2G5_9BACL|nr:YaaR family protein [Scopulibacillus daqui]MBM7646484.1 uncharacterized protein YaaR (DUF327 family) [Scopulibacillus daqui]